MLLFMQVGGLQGVIFCYFRVICQGIENNKITVCTGDVLFSDIRMATQPYLRKQCVSIHENNTNNIITWFVVRARAYARGRAEGVNRLSALDARRRFPCKSAR